MVDSWREPLLAALQPVLKQLGPQRRPLLVGQHCAGMGPASAVFEALDMPYREVFASDPKPAALAFRAGYGCQPCERQYRTIRDVIESPPPDRPDLELTGFPCQPYSTMRNYRFTGQLPERHAQYSVADDVLRAMTVTRPRCAIVEQVRGFAMSQNNGPSELDGFIAKVRRIGLWYFLVMSVALSIWVPATRDRIYILFVDRECGGPEVLQRALAIARQVTLARQESQPTPLSTFWLPAYIRSCWTAPVPSSCIPGRHCVVAVASRRRLQLQFQQQ